MKNKLITFWGIFFGFVLVFVLQKPLFMLYHFDLYRHCTMLEWLQVMLHGLPLDLSMSGYLTVIPGLMLMVSFWKDGNWLRKALLGYLAVMNVVIAVIFVSDLELYTYWGFRLDSTPLFYLKSPSDAMASVPLLLMILLPLAMILIWYLLYRADRLFLKHIRISHVKGVRCAGYSFVLLLLTGILFIPIRGGFTVSTMNVGKAYFSTNMKLNHAAINPMFSFMSSLAKENDFASQYRFFDDTKAHTLFKEMQNVPNNDTVPSLLTTSRPNIILIVLESFSGKVIAPLGGLPDITPNMNRFYQEGVSFTNFYANSFRTDRGLVSILSGYPAQPSTSVMKYPSKTQSLPSISSSLKRQGYEIEFLYGGDADFTNMRSYFIGAGFDRIVCDQNFPISDRMSKWGVNDEKMFRYLTEELRQPQSQPFMKMFLTLSSHEPFDVPFKKFDDKYLNSVAYTDSCLGRFVDELKATPQWNNTLVIMLPDHCMHYPASISIADPGRYHIPMVWIGGAVRQPKQVDVYGSQIDLAATLLGQMNISSSDFSFSKDMLNADNPHFAYYTFKDGFGYIRDTVQYVYDCEANQALFIQNNPNLQFQNQGKAFLQCLYDDLSSR